MLGRALAERIERAGERSRIFDLNPPDFEVRDMEYTQGDVTDARGMARAAKGCARIFHLAAAMPQAALDEQGFRRINVGGVRNAADACIENKIPTLIFSSTIEIYGPQTEYPVPEDAPKLFTGPYSRNKLAAEELLLQYRDSHGLKVSFLRMPMIIGPGFYHEKSMIRLMRMVRRGRAVPLPAAPLPYHVVASSDAAEAFWLAAQLPQADGEAFNVAAPDWPEVKQLFRDFLARVGSKSRVLPVPMPLMKGFVRFAMRVGRPLPMVDTPPELLPFVLTGGAYDISKAAGLLGYDPQKTCLDCLEELYRLLKPR